MQHLREGKQRGWTEKSLIPFLWSVTFICSQVSLKIKQNIWRWRRIIWLVFLVKKVWRTVLPLTPKRRITWDIPSQLSSKWGEQDTVCPSSFPLLPTPCPPPPPVERSLNMTLHEISLPTHDVSLGNYLQARRSLMKPHIHTWNLVVALWSWQPHFPLAQLQKAALAGSSDHAFAPDMVAGLTHLPRCLATYFKS